MSTSEQYQEKIGEQMALEEFLKDWISTGVSLAEKLENPVISIGSSQLRLHLISSLGTVDATLDGTLKMRYLGSRASDIVGRKGTTFSLEIHHVPKDCIKSTERDVGNLTLISSVFYGSYVIRTTVLSKSGLIEKGVAGRVPSAILRISGDVGYLCLELNSLE